MKKLTMRTKRNLFALDEIRLLAANKKEIDGVTKYEVNSRTSGYLLLCKNP